MPFVKIDTATAGNTTVATALAGKAFRVVGGFLSVNTEAAVTFYDGTAKLTGAVTLINTAGPWTLPAAPHSPGGGRQAYMQGSVNTDLKILLSANVQLSGVIEYDFVGG
jgi:hypothetical protein